MKFTLTPGKTLASIAIFLVAIALPFSSCKKEPGPKGDTGPQGPAGKNGVSNIQTSTVTTNNLSWTLDNSDNSYNATLTYAAITKDVVDKGTVQVFLGDGTGQEWAALPLSYGTVQFNYSYGL